MSGIACFASNVNPPLFYGNIGFSEGAEALTKETSEITNHFAKTVTFGEHISGLLEQLLKAREECAEENWDGYGGKAVREESFSNALKFVMSLPLSIPLPEVYVDPEGDVTFEWYEGKRQVFSVSIIGGNELSYAGLFGANRTYGVEYMLDGVPKKILDGIAEVLSE